MSDVEGVKMPRRPLFSQEWGEEYEMRLVEYMHYLESSTESEEEIDVVTLSGESYCGCSTCYEREYLLMATALAIEGFTRGEVELVDADAS